MTPIKERAIKMIQRMPEDDMLYVINILQNLEAMTADKEKDRQNAKRALTDIMNMEKRLPEDFDSRKELQEAREEKYLFARSLPKNALDKIRAIEYSKAIETKKAVTKRSTHCPLLERAVILDKGC